jgi:TonB family protein
MKISAALSALVALLAAFITRSPAIAEPCPVTVASLNLVALGSTRHLVKYRVDLSTAEPVTYSLQLLVIDGSPEGPGKVFVSTVDFKKADDHATASIRFVWPTELSFVIIDNVGRENSPTIHCDDVPTTPSPSAPKDVLFDDGSTARSRSVQAIKFVDVAITHRVMPIYPESDVRNCHAGVVAIRVTIDPAGKVLNAAVQTPSLFEGLDQAALDAAKASGFSPALENGVPITTEGTLEYRFTIPPPFKC